ncbi:UNVERIFIED_ORG: NADPH2:quinone reductase [Gordonia westfalica J30]
MKAIVTRRFGSPDGLELVEIESPIPSPGEVLIETEAIGVGGVDAAIRRGTLGHGYPHGMIPGGEVAGSVLQVGDGVSEQWLGKRVWAHTGTSGGYADHATARLADITVLPSALSSSDAVALGSAATVAHFALKHAHFAADETLLIRGASGSIGIATLEHAVRQGASRIAVTTASSSRGQKLLAMGATDVLGRSGKDASDHAPDFDVIIDVVGGADVPSFIDQLAPNGRMILVGAVAGFPPPTFGMKIMETFQHSRSVATFSLASVPVEERNTARAAQFEAAVRGTLHPVVHATMPLADAAKAHEAMDAGTVFGRIVLTN